MYFKVYCFMYNRKEIENKIKEIISYIDQEKTLKPLIWSLKLFSLEELLQLKIFLEKWDYQIIYKLIDKKIKEYIEIMEEIKQMKICEKKEKLKKQEEKENKQEQIDIDILLA